MFASPKQQIPIGIANMAAIILIWHIPKAIIAATDPNPLEMIPTRQGLSKPRTTGIDP